MTPTRSKKPGRGSFMIAKGVALLLLGFLVGGCRSPLPNYATRSAWPHKDVVVISVTLDDRLTPEGYRRIVEREFGAELGKLDSDDLLVYEVRFEFLVRTDDAHLGHQRVAEVSLRGLDSADGAPFSDTQVVLY